ncbi:MAG: AAA family ATPase [Collinsella sp.]
MSGTSPQLPERQLFAETVFDDVAFGPRNMNMPEDEVRSRVCEALASVNLTPTDELLARSPFSLSGGQQRSVALAGVLAMRQDVLVLDEPMAGLDPDGRRRVRDLLRALKHAGSTLIMVTHSMEDVAELADHVIVLERGRALLSGSPAEVLPPCSSPRG